MQVDEVAGAVPCRGYGLDDELLPVAKLVFTAVFKSHELFAGHRRVEVYVVGFAHVLVLLYPRFVEVREYDDVTIEYVRVHVFGKELVSLGLFQAQELATAVAVGFFLLNLLLV